MTLQPRVLLVSVLALTVSVSAQLPVGNYTIDPTVPTGGTNYQTWADAVTALGAGIVGVGPTTFTVASATFNEVVSIPTIAGTSAASPITFIAMGAPAVIDAGGALDAFLVNNAQAYLTFENIEIRNFTRYGLYVLGTSTLRATFCNFRRIVADAPATTSTTISPIRVFYSNDCNFEDCRFAGGGYTLRSEQINRTNFRRCEFDGKNLASSVLAPFNSNDADNLWENCFVHSCGPSGLGMNINLSSYGNIFLHNTVIVNTTARGVLLGSLTTWSRANVFRNNIVINTGTGSCILYGAGAGAPGILQVNDVDYNVYYAPNGTAVGMEAGVAPNFVTGSLAAWQSFLAANPGIIPAAGGTNWDGNSIEADPQLVNATAPFDIHLLPTSPAIGAGTSVCIPGTYISYSQTYVTTDDRDGDPRPATGIDIGADQSGCAVPLFETNDLASALNLNGATGSACSAAVTVVASGGAVALNLASTNVGLPWEAVVSLAPVVPFGGGALQTGAGQFINVNLGAPLLFLVGGGAPSFSVPFPGASTINFTAPPGPFVATVQMVNVDPTHPDGFAASQPSQLTVP